MLRHLLTTHLPGLLVLSVLFAVVVAGIATAIGAFGTVEHSMWEAASQVPRWYVLIMGGVLTSQYLPLYIIHGETRRDFAISAAYLVVLFTGAVAVLMAVGFAVERVVFRILDRPHVRPPEAEGLFDSPDQFGVIFLTFWLVFLVWMVIGAFVAAAFYRQAWAGVGGALMIPVGFLLVNPAELVVHSRAVPSLLLAGFDPADTPAALAISLCLLSLLAGLALTWAFIRDIPVRNKSA